MPDKSPHQSQVRKPAKSIKQKRADKRAAEHASAAASVTADAVKRR